VKSWPEFFAVMAYGFWFLNLTLPKSTLPMWPGTVEKPKDGLVFGLSWFRHQGKIKTYTVELVVLRIRFSRPWQGVTEFVQKRLERIKGTGAP
jgi:hypothetical protein